MSEKMVKKIKALLTKAESTSFPAEQEVFAAKAAELMAQHQIDEAQLQSEDEQRPVIQIISRRYVVMAPYSLDRLMLIAQVADAMGGACYYIKQRRDGTKTRTNSKDHNTYAVLIGTDSDLDDIEMMLESLNNQMEYAREVAQKAQSFRGMGDKKVWNATFIRGYAARISTRIREVYSSTASGAGTGVALVLRDKKLAIQEELDRRAGGKQKMTRQHHSAGWVQGQMAADRSTIQRSLDQ